MQAHKKGHSFSRNEAANGSGSSRENSWLEFQFTPWRRCRRDRLPLCYQSLYSHAAKNFDGVREDQVAQFANPRGVFMRDDAAHRYFSDDL